MADPLIKAGIQAVEEFVPSIVKQSDNVIKTNTSNIPTNITKPISETVPLTPKRMEFNTSAEARDYVFNYVTNQPTPSTRGMPEIWVRSDDDMFVRRKAKAAEGKLVDVTEPKHLKLNVFETYQQSTDLRRSREIIPEDEIREIFDRFQQPELADEYIGYVREGNRRVQNAVAAENKAAGYMKVSYGHKKSLAKGGLNLPRNVEVEDYSINVSKGAKGDLPDPLLRALDVSFSWEEDIIKFLDPEIAHFWGDLTSKEKATLVETVAKYTGTDPIEDVVNDALVTLNRSTRKSRASAKVGRSGQPANFKQATQFPPRIQNHITRSQEIGIPEPSWKSGSIDYTWRPETNTGQIDIPTQSKKTFKGLRDEFFEQIEELPSGSVWELNPKFKDAKRRSIYGRLFKDDPRITRNDDPTLGWVLTVP